MGDLTREVKEVSDRTLDSYVFYNNHYGAKAVVNAVQMRLQLGQRLPAELPDTLLESYPFLKDSFQKGS